MVFNQQADVDSDDRPHKGSPSSSGVRRSSDASSSLRGSQQTYQDDLTRTNTRESRKRRSRHKSVSIDDSSNQDPGYDADVEVIRPYAIEEPEDEVDTSPQSTWPATPRLLDSVPSWQNEIVNSMRNLYCDSDSTDNVPWLKQKRGRKRKSASRAANYEENNQERMPGLTKDDPEMPAHDDPISSPRKLRRRSTKSRKPPLFVLHVSI